MGKTSLVRLLTGKDFIPNLHRGIENTVVDTVDIQSIDTTHWEVVKPEYTRCNELFVSGVVESLNTNQLLKVEEEPVICIQVQHWFLLLLVTGFQPSTN